MADNLLESYNPLYDVHLRQYFALPHMQKHLKNLGLLESKLDINAATQDPLRARHRQMMDQMLQNRERVLQQLTELQKKLDAAEKVDLYRRIRSGITNIEELDRNQGHMSRSLSRPARSAAKPRRKTTGRQRRHSGTVDANEMIRRVEENYQADTGMLNKKSQNIYNRLAASVYKYQFLHRLDDRTLYNYILSLKKALKKLERFREVTFGPHTMAKHPPENLPESWFFRRRSLPSLNNTNTGSAAPSTSINQNLHRRSRHESTSRKVRSGKSQSPLTRSRSHVANDEPPSKMIRTTSRPAAYRLPPLPNLSVSNNKKAKKEGSASAVRLPPPNTSVLAAPKKPVAAKLSQSAGTQKYGATTKKFSGKKQQEEKKPQQHKSKSATSTILPVIAGAVVGAGISGIVVNAIEDDHDDENPIANVEIEEIEAPQEEGAPMEVDRIPSPSVSLAASQTTEEMGSKGGGDSEWEPEHEKLDNKSSGDEIASEGRGTETRPTPEPFLEHHINLESNELIPVDNASDGEQATIRNRRSVTEEDAMEIEASTPHAKEAGYFDREESVVQNEPPEVRVEEYEERETTPQNMELEDEHIGAKYSESVEKEASEDEQEEEDEFHIVNAQPLGISSEMEDREERVEGTELQNSAYLELEKEELESIQNFESQKEVEEDDEPIERIYNVEQDLGSPKPKPEELLENVTEIEPHEEVEIEDVQNEKIEDDVPYEVARKEFSEESDLEQEEKPVIVQMLESEENLNDEYIERPKESEEFEDTEEKEIIRSADESISQTQEIRNVSESLEEDQEHEIKKSEYELKPEIENSERFDYEVMMDDISPVPPDTFQKKVDETKETEIDRINEEENFENKLFSQDNDNVDNYADEFLDRTKDIERDENQNNKTESPDSPELSQNFSQSNLETNAQMAEEAEQEAEGEGYGRGRRPTGLEAYEAEQIRRIVHPNLESEHGPTTDSVRSLASSSTNETRMEEPEKYESGAAEVVPAEKILEEQLTHEETQQEEIQKFEEQFPRETNQYMEERSPRNVVEELSPREAREEEIERRFSRETEENIEKLSTRESGEDLENCPIEFMEQHSQREAENPKERFQRDITELSPREERDLEERSPRDEEEQSPRDEEGRSQRDEEENAEERSQQDVKEMSPREERDLEKQEDTKNQFLLEAEDTVQEDDIKEPNPELQVEPISAGEVDEYLSRNKDIDEKSEGDISTKEDNSKNDLIEVNEPGEEKPQEEYQQDSEATAFEPGHSDVRIEVILTPSPDHRNEDGYLIEPETQDEITRQEEKTNVIDDMRSEASKEEGDNQSVEFYDYGGERENENHTVAQNHSEEFQKNIDFEKKQNQADYTQSPHREHIPEEAQDVERSEKPLLDGPINGDEYEKVISLNENEAVYQSSNENFISFTPNEAIKSQIEEDIEEKERPQSGDLEHKISEENGNKKEEKQKDMERSPTSDQSESRLNENDGEGMELNNENSDAQSYRSDKSLRRVRETGNLFSHPSIEITPVPNGNKHAIDEENDDISMSQVAPADDGNYHRKSNYYDLDEDDPTDDKQHGINSNEDSLYDNNTRQHTNTNGTSLNGHHTNGLREKHPNGTYHLDDDHIEELSKSSNNNEKERVNEEDLLNENESSNHKIITENQTHSMQTVYLVPSDDEDVSVREAHQQV